MADDPVLPQTDDGIRSLLEYWKRRQNPANYVLKAEPGHYQISVQDEISIRLSEQVLRPVGITSEEQFGDTRVVPDEELVILAAVIPADVTRQVLFESLLVRGVSIPWREILRKLEHDPAFFTKIHPRALEELIAEAYKASGYTDVILTPYSGDRGRDVIVSATLPGIGTIKIVDQVKRYSLGRKVPADDVRALAGVIYRDHDVSKGIVTTTSDFAPGVYEEFKSLMDGRLQLKNGRKLKEWLTELADRE